MKTRIILIVSFVVLVACNLRAQMYFPPITSSQWDTLPPSNLGWCSNNIDSFYEFLGSNKTKAFILLKDGKIVLEKYFNGHSINSNWYWASAAKTLTALLIGIAQQDGKLSILDSSSKYLGNGWTSTPDSVEKNITILNQLTMSTGLDDEVADPNCTIDSCLKFKALPGSRWAYHNGPYTLLDSVLQKATGSSLNDYVDTKVSVYTGIDGLFVKQGFNNLYLSTARGMARFGLLMLNKGMWNGNNVLSDSNYFNQMVSTSQQLNKSYGYLCWLNGKSSYMIPQTQFVFQGSLCPNAPSDMYAALGKNGQFINVVPSLNMVWIRMGDAPDNNLVPFLFNNDIWAQINKLNCTSSSIEKYLPSDELKIYPNQVQDLAVVSINDCQHQITYKLFNAYGNCLQSGIIDNQISFKNLNPGVYYLYVKWNNHSAVKRILKL